MSLIQTVPLGGVEFGEKASAEDVAAAKAAFQPVSYGNVRLWEIYDEDGAEIEVGEVRKTIDGVKKKKPVYKKEFVGGTLSTGTTVIATLDNVEKIIESRHCINNKQNQLFPEYSLSNNTVAVFLDGTSVKINLGTAWTGNDAIQSYNVTWKYTKTTDEWQPV